MTRLRTTDTGAIVPAGRTPRPRGRAHQAQRIAVATRDRWTCALCGNPIDPRLRRPHPDALHVDHIHPRAFNGTDDAENQRATHARCNIARGTG